MTFYTEKLRNVTLNPCQGRCGLEAEGCYNMSMSDELALKYRRAMCWYVRSAAKQTHIALIRNSVNNATNNHDLDPCCTSLQVVSPQQQDTVDFVYIPSLLVPLHALIFETDPIVN